MFGTRPAASPANAVAICSRCGTCQRLLAGDGRVVCWPCVLAWGSFARLVTAGPIALEPGMVENCRLGHRRPRVGCPWCLGRRDHTGLGLSDIDSQRGPAG